MLRDNALKCYSDHAYFIPHKPIEIRQYMNKNGSETVSDNIDFGSHDPSRSHDLGNVNWPLSRKPLQIERTGANFTVSLLPMKLQLLKILIFGSHDPQGHMISET